MRSLFRGGGHRGAGVFGLALTAICLAITLPGPAAAGRPVPQALVTTRCAHPCDHLVGVYRVRPRIIQMIEADGGALHIKWSHWSRRLATGRGTSVASNTGGVTRSRIRVELRRAVGRRFTRMKVTYRTSSGRFIGRFSLGTAYDDDAWVRNENCGNADLDSYCS